MLTEAKAPIEQRYLVIEGHVSASSLELVKAGLPAQRPGHARVVFVSFAYADLPLGKTFQRVFPKEYPEQGVAAVSVIRAVTQQFGEPFDVVPDGWKTICLIEFPHGVSALIDELPTVDAWHESTRKVCLSSEETWQALCAPKQL